MNSSDGVRIGVCGRISQTVFTADTAQRTIVTMVFGDDGNHDASMSEIETGLRGSSGISLTVGTEYLFLDYQGSYITTLNSELAAGRWVIGNLCVGSSYSCHSIVITSYNSTTTKYTYWDPWTDGYGTFLKTSLENNEIVICSYSATQEWELFSFQYAR